jgi:hypothetical protein
MPFTSKTGVSGDWFGAVGANNLTITGTPSVHIQGNTTTMNVEALNNGTTSALTLDTAATLNVTGWYETA